MFQELHLICLYPPIRLKIDCHICFVDRVIRDRDSASDKGTEEGAGIKVRFNRRN